ncbi:hypothetical protein TREMEDRAFT_73995 [Tremella mesenterica DSM 1558]|uniref:uncharacterized protein n=1 Tax=Tremella mesenterica (strain ATCC 24925 / CBS 8224 / DSM 1558 / NBRC 9311 / NRRL Y-6157 / RJB 2259-6 / UBC 559-6) TaxID=578456 RepID=UPI0003F49170|nr:uncharacterized protein TREMEDRAFT_73995 [Tremella mesenterica DSM 1558]EIW69005.1 hypothetical protein TREMEDRAFT_73995 [Tremella mesenterica DSM 1558]
MEAIRSMISTPRTRILLVLGAIFIIFVVHRSTSSTWKSLSPHKDDYGLIGDQFIQPPNFDMVVSHYEEPYDVMADTIEQIKSRLPSSSSIRVTIYHKGSRTGSELEELSNIADRVIKLDNIGREGETYLRHIVRHYDNAESDMADHTIFLQPHLAWDWVLLPRVSIIKPNTGFLSLGPYINMTRGVDVHGNSFPRINDIYSAFRGDFSPPYSILATWAGQFVVSRERILSNQLHLYTNLLAKFHAPPEHWIWTEGWHNNEPSNPTLGHALERSWPLIFGCEDAKMAETCGEGHGPTCTCFDTV